MTSTAVHLALNFIDWACGHPYDELATQDPAEVTCPDCLSHVPAFGAPLAEAHACRLCDHPATSSTEYAVMRDGEVYTSVTHATCERHNAGLAAEMVQAGWVALS